jgi:hypothetical protein
MNSLLSSDFVNSFYNNYERKKYEECEYIKNSVIEQFNKSLSANNVDLGSRKIKVLDNEKLEILKYKSFEDCKQYNELKRSLKELNTNLKTHFLYSINNLSIHHNIINKEIEIFQQIHIIK